MNRKKVFVSAYVSNNLGDDLFIKELYERYNDVDFYMLGPKKYSNEWSNVKNLKFIGFNKLLWKVFNNSLLVYLIVISFISLFIKTNILVTGSLFDENTTSNKSLVKKRINNFFFDKVAYMSCSMGYYKTEKFVSKCKKVISGVDDICFRDDYSYELFKDLKNVRLAKDMIFQMEVESSQLEDYIVISVIDLGSRKELKDFEKIYLKKNIEMIEEILAKFSKVYLMGFCENERDHVAINKIIELLPNNIAGNVSVINHHNMKESLDVIKKSKGVVATRFHSYILAYIMNKPMYNISYSMKTNNSIASLNEDIRIMDIEKIESLNAKEVVNELLKVPTYNLQKTKQSAEKQFLFVDKLLSI